MGGVDGTLPIASLPATLQKYQQLPDLYQKINGVKICLNEISSLFLPEESQASITGDVDNRVAGVCALSIIKFILNLSLKKMAHNQHNFAQQDSQINNFRQLCRSTHTDVSNQQMAISKQQQQQVRQSNEECIMSFETKDAGHKDQHGRASLNNVIEDTYTESSKSRRSTIPSGNPYKQPLPSGKSTQGQKEGRDQTSRINQYYLPERKHNSTVNGGTAQQQYAKSIEKFQKLKTSCRDQYSCPQTPELSARNINQKDLYMTPNSSRMEKPVRHRSHRENQDFTRVCDPELVKIIMSSIVDQIYAKASRKLPGWREQTRNIFQTSVCSLTASKVSSNGNSKIEYIEDFADSNREASEIQINGKNQGALNNTGVVGAICPSDEYALMGKYPNKCDDDEEQEVIETGEKNPYNDTPDLKVTQNQKSSIQTVPSALEEFVHGMENQRQQSNFDKLRDSQESRKETLNDSGKVKMFSTKLNPQNKILTQQRRIGRMSPPLPHQSNYQEISSRGGRNKTVERHIVDLNQLNNQLGGAAAQSYHVMGDQIENKPLKVVNFGSGQTYSIYNSQRERSKESYTSLLSKGSRLKTHSNSTVEISARDRQQACFPPDVDEEELLNFRNLICSRQISNEGPPPTARSQTVQRKYTRVVNEEEHEEIQLESNAKLEQEHVERNDHDAGRHTDATNPIQSVMLESEDARKVQPDDHDNNMFPRIDLEEENASEEEIASEEDDSEYMREKERQEQTRRMIEQAKQNRKKCIDDSSSSSEHNNGYSVNYDQPIQIEEADQDSLDFEVINAQDDVTDDKKREQPKGAASCSQVDSAYSNKVENQPPLEDNVHQNYLNADVDDTLQLEPMKSSINLQKIIMENNKNTQRWDLPNFSNHSSNESDEELQPFTRMLIVEEEDDDNMIGHGNQNRQGSISFEEEEHEVLGFEHSDDDYGSQHGENNEHENRREEIKRTPTPNCQFASNHHDKENNAQRLDGIKNYLKNDNQFESVPEEIEAENREESDIEHSSQSPLNFDQQNSNSCTEKSELNGEFEDRSIFCKDTPEKGRPIIQQGSPMINLEEIGQNHNSKIGQNTEDDEYDDFHINNVSLEVLTSRIKQRNQELLENSQVSSNHMKPDLDRSYSSCNSNLRKREDIKKPAPLQFDDIDADDNINPLISFQAEEQQSRGKSEHMETNASEHRTKQRSQRVYLKDHNGNRLTMFNSSDDMTFEEKQKEAKKSQRKSMDLSHNQKIINSASRLRLPMGGSKLDNNDSDNDSFHLNKSMEIKKRSRNKNNKPVISTQSKTQVINKRQSTLNRRDTSSSAQNATSGNKLFFKPYSSTSGGTSSGRKRYTSCYQVQQPEIIQQKPKTEKLELQLQSHSQSKNIKDILQNFSTHRKNLNSPKIMSSQMNSTKMKNDQSPNNNKNSVVSGLSVISQLSFIKQSFASPSANAEAQLSKQQHLESQQDTPMDSERLRNHHSKDTPKVPTEKRHRGDRDDYVIDGLHGISDDAMPGQGQHNSQQSKYKLLSKPLQKKNSQDAAQSNTKKSISRNNSNLQYSQSNKSKAQKLREGVLNKNSSQKVLSNDVRNSSLLQQSCNRSENSFDSDPHGNLQQSSQQPQPTQRRSLNNIMGFGQKKKLFK